jgi:hypothetical protein
VRERAPTSRRPAFWSQHAAQAKAELEKAALPSYTGIFHPVGSELTIAKATRSQIDAFGIGRDTFVSGLVI